MSRALVPFNLKVQEKDAQRVYRDKSENVK